MYADHRGLHSFPTRRSSDLKRSIVLAAASVFIALSTPAFAQRGTPPPPTDRTKASYMSAAEVAAAIEKRSEEHTSELQSRLHLVCRLLLEKKNTSTCTCSES